MCRLLVFFLLVSFFTPYQSLGTEIDNLPPEAVHEAFETSTFPELSRLSQTNKAFKNVLNDYPFLKQVLIRQLMLPIVADPLEEPPLEKTEISGQTKNPTTSVQSLPSALARQLVKSLISRELGIYQTEGSTTQARQSTEILNKEGDQHSKGGLNDPKPNDFKDYFEGLPPAIQGRNLIGKFAYLYERLLPQVSGLTVEAIEALIDVDRYKQLIADVQAAYEAAGVPKESTNSLVTHYLGYDLESGEHDPLRAMQTLSASTNSESFPEDDGTTTLLERFTAYIVADAEPQINARARIQANGIEIELSDLDLKFIPIGLIPLHATTLYLNTNHLTSVPPEIGNLQKLRSLYLKSNFLTSLPPEIGKLKKLERLNLFSNRLTSVPPEIGELTKLERLTLSTNHLTSLPPEIGKLEKLEGVALAENRLTSLPPEIGNWRNLTLLNLYDNRFTFLPPEIWNLQELTHLYLPKNRLTSLPPEIGKLKKLEHLSLSEEIRIASLPEEKKNLRDLAELFFSNNHLTSLPPEIGNLQELTKLSLSNIRLTSLPPEIGNLQKLTKLSLSNNSLTSLPPEIGKLKKLRQLSLSNNFLTSLPPEIGNLQKLRELSLKYNYLTSLPPEIGNWRNLTMLNLANNRLTSLPPEIGNLEKLERLNLDYNDLTSLPPEIGNLEKLEHLNLSKNPNIQALGDSGEIDFYGIQRTQAFLQLYREALAERDEAEGRAG